MTDRSNKWDDKDKNPFKDIIDCLEKVLKDCRHKYYQKKYWKYTKELTYEDAGADKSNPNHIVSNSSLTTIGLFYKPIQKLIDLYWKTYELRLPKYELNDNFPLNNDGYTVITHSLLLERGRYHSKGPLLINNLKQVKFIAKKQHDLKITIDMYSHKGHNAGITVKETGRIIIKNTIIQAKWKKQSTNKDAQEEGDKK